MVAERNEKKVYDGTTVEADLHLLSINNDEEGFHHLHHHLVRPIFFIHSMYLQLLVNNFVFFIKKNVVIFSDNIMLFQ